ncbi:MAG: TonB-dependent receptor [Myxococcota bacterium]|nr:TonB-dependent receptor [Myxococcota bacterium]
MSAPTEMPEQETPERGPPVMSPFSGPAPGRPMSPPASLAGLDLELEGLEGRLLTEAVVTTSSKRAQRLQDVPMTVAWIPGEELEGTGQFSLCEAIQYFPGMECRRGAMRKVAISARGLGNNFLSNRLLLLQDGRPQTDPWTGQFYGDETTPLTNVKQVEVIRGPGSSLYGSNAFSGVINVIRRSPSDLMAEGRDFGMDARILGGQYNSFRGQATAAARAGPVEGLINYYGFLSDGPDLLGDPTQGVVDEQEWSQVHQVSGIVDIAKVVRLDVDFTDADLGRPGGNQISAVGTCGRCHYTPNDREHVQNLNANAQADLRVNDNIRVFGQAYALFKRREVDLENVITGNLDTTLGKRSRYGGEARALISMADALSVTVGADAKYDVVNNRNVFPDVADPNGLLTQTILGAYVDAEFRPLPNLVLGGGARYDHYLIPEAIWQSPSSQISPRASIVYHVVDRLLTLRTNYGRAFRAPTLSELVINQQMYASTLLGNQNLRAETLDTFEAAVDYWPFDGAARFTVTGFYNLAKNFINQEHMGGSTSQFQNIGDARVVGFEAEAAAQIKEINSSFSLAYQFLHARSLPFEGRPEAWLDYAPRHRVYFRGRTNIGSAAFMEFFAVFVSQRFDPSVEGDAHERISLEPYLTANARLGVNVTKGMTVSLLGSNIFNSRHEESFGFPVPGASLFGEIKYTY